MTQKKEFAGASYVSEVAPTPSINEIIKEVGVILPNRKRNDFDSLMTKVKKQPDGCWLWQGYTERGYGKASWEGRTQPVHRIFYRTLKGEIKEGLCLDHLCRVRNCVNPDHLEQVTWRKNILRGIGRGAVNARKTHCSRGHKFDKRNTLRRPDGFRACRDCASIMHCVKMEMRKVEANIRAEATENALHFMDATIRADEIRAQTRQSIYKELIDAIEAGKIEGSVLMPFYAGFNDGLKSAAQIIKQKQEGDIIS